MASVADQLRLDTATRIGQMSVPARIELALSLGDADLELYMRATGKPHDAAIRELHVRHARGRIPSRSASSAR